MLISRCIANLQIRAARPHTDQIHVSGRKMLRGLRGKNDGHETRTRTHDESDADGELWERRDAAAADAACLCLSSILRILKHFSPLLPIDSDEESAQRLRTYAD